MRTRAWPANGSAARASLSSIRLSIGPIASPPPLTARSICRATRSGGAPASARARLASRCQAARTGAGMSSYSAARISGCRNTRPGLDSACTPTAHLVDRRDQVRHAAPQHNRRIRDREIRAEQGRRPQHRPHRPGHKSKAVRYGRRQRAWRGTARQLRGTRLGDGQTGTARQRGD